METGRPDGTSKTTTPESDDLADPLATVGDAVAAAAAAAGDPEVIECAEALREGRPSSLDAEAVYERLMAVGAPLRSSFAALAVVLAVRARRAGDPAQARMLAENAIRCADDAAQLSGDPGCVRWRDLQVG